tara:strand:- start:279 stop:608 length:330 start_codon:yes stop_codon:yes gene_type:complete
MIRERIQLLPDDLIGEIYKYIHKPPFDIREFKLYHTIRAVHYRIPPPTIRIGWDTYRPTLVVEKNGKKHIRIIDTVFCVRFINRGKMILYKYMFDNDVWEFTMRNFNNV